MRRNLDDDYLFNVLLHCEMHLCGASNNAMQRYNYFCDWQKKIPTESGSIVNPLIF